MWPPCTIALELRSAYQREGPQLSGSTAVTTAEYWGGTLIHLRALVTMASASMAPNPNLWLTLRSAPLVTHCPSTSLSWVEVYATRYCTSRHVRLGLHHRKSTTSQSYVQYCTYVTEKSSFSLGTHFACNTSAMVPDMSGVEALVPVNSVVQPPLSVVVLYNPLNLNSWIKRFW